MTKLAAPSGTASSPRLAREVFRDIVAYPGDREPYDVDLSDNTNLFGAPPAALQAARSLEPEDLCRYPGIASARLRDALAAYVGVDSACILTGCGSDDVLDAAMRTLAEPGEALAFSDPTFSMIPVFARVNGLEPVALSFTASHDIDADALLATGARIIYVCSPNNPTGCMPSRTSIERVLERAPGIVILDEAYAEFSEATFVSRASSHARLIVTRTMSKAFGLAGVRVGYAVASPAIVDEVQKARGPYKTNGPGERAVLAALAHDVPWMRETVSRTTECRERLADALRARGLAPLPSAANFLLVPLTRARQIADDMRQRDVVVRPFGDLRGIGEALRITVGPWELMEKALAALDAARP